ncbi:MAG: hypothetical protein DDT29_02495 [Dehalococcoidia bacterium]|nr:hypothetical protein [Bacillota bacterium]
MEEEALQCAEFAGAYRLGHILDYRLVLMMVQELGHLAVT